MGDYVYFSGGYYNTSPKGGDGMQLCRVKTSTGEVELAAIINDGPDGPGRAAAIRAVGTNIYYTAGDGDYITSIGDTDRELYRYDTLTGTNHKITTNETLYRVDDAGDGGGTGVLSSYYFVASPTKDDARWGARKIYCTNPENDAVEEVTGPPAMHQNTAEVIGMTAGPGGLFANIDLGDSTNDTDVFFVPTPFSFVDPVTHILTIDATESSDDLQLKVSGTDLVMNLNGVQERRALSTFSSIAISLKAGDDRLTTNENVTKNISVNGDSGNDTLVTGSGNDSLLSGSGKNQLYGGAGNDRLRGSNGSDFMNGGDGKDRLYGRGRSDNLRGANGVDFLYGDDPTGAAGNDTLSGDQSADKLYGYGGDDLLVGGAQNDSVFGGDGNDTMMGQDGNDTLEGGAGNDEFWGNDGDDIFFAQDGALDLLNGGAGNDSATRNSNEQSIDLIEI